MSIRSRIYPNNTEDKLERFANLLGFDYTHIKHGRFPMAWYETYGYHLKDYLFDRLEPRNRFASVLKGLGLVLLTLFYLVPFGVWLSLVGQIYAGLKEAFTRDKKDKLVS